MLGEGPAVEALAAAFFAAMAFSAPSFVARAFLARATVTLKDARLPCEGTQMRLCLCARRNGCKPMMACTLFPTLAGKLGASSAAVYVMPSLVTRVMLTARLFSI